MKAATRQTNDQRTMDPALPIRRYIIARKALPVGPGSSVTSPAQTQRTMLRIHPIAYNNEISCNFRYMAICKTYTGVEDGNKNSDRSSNGGSVDLLTDVRS